MSCHGACQQDVCFVSQCLSLLTISTVPVLVIRSGVPCGEMEVCGDVSRPGLRSEADQAQRMTVGLPQVGAGLYKLIRLRSLTLNLTYACKRPGVCEGKVRIVSSFRHKLLA